MRFVRLIALISIFLMAIMAASCGQDGDSGAVVNYQPGQGYDQPIPPNQQQGDSDMLLSRIDPAIGKVATPVYIYGENFPTGATVQLCGVAVTSATWISAGEIHLMVPALGTADKTCDLKITSPDGSFVQGSGIFQYDYVSSGGGSGTRRPGPLPV
jgi:hypothetical protein